MIGASVFCSADTIVLKNGRRIVADVTRELNGRIEYEVGDNSFAIPKALVDHVDNGGTPTRQATTENVPDFAATESIPRISEITARIIRDGRVDIEALNAIEAAGNTQETGVAYLIAARTEALHRNIDQALRYFQRATARLPEDGKLLVIFARIMQLVHRPADAIAYAEHAVRLEPNSSEVLAYLGVLYFQSDKLQEAVRVLKRSLAIKNDEQVAEFLARAERELSLADKYEHHESAHFAMRYEGRQVGGSVGREILETLDRDYDDLVRALGVTPRTNISVILYTEKDFFDITQSPSWSAAVNDGRIHVPIKGVASMNSALARVLRHELTHSFINEATRGRCPSWLNEGLAQLMTSDRIPAETGRVMAKVYAEQRQVPLQMLEASFMNLSTGQAHVAYSESLAAIDFINDTYGMSDLRTMLERIGQGATPEAALRSTVHYSYAELDVELARYLKNKYGS